MLKILCLSSRSWSQYIRVIKLKKLIRKLITSSKLKKFTRHEENVAAKAHNEPIPTHAIINAKVVPTIFGGDKDSLRQVSFQRLEVKEVNSTSMAREPTLNLSPSFLRERSKLKWQPL